jgi:hypothetical protein
LNKSKLAPTPIGLKTIIITIGVGVDPALSIKKFKGRVRKHSVK